MSFQIYINDNDGRHHLATVENSHEADRFREACKNVEIVEVNPPMSRNEFSALVVAVSIVGGAAILGGAIIWKLATGG